MTSEPASPSKESGRSLLYLWWLIPTLILAYPLGMIPLALLCRWGIYLRLLPRQETIEVLDVLAAPFFWLAESSKAFESLLDWFLRNVINALSP